MNILVGVAKRVATPPSDAVIVCGNSDYTLTFDFDEEWSAETVKVARFVWFSKNKTYSEEVTFNGNIVTVPILSNTNAVHVGVYAGNLRTTTPAKIVCEPSILCYGQDANVNPGDMALIKGQIAELVNALKDIDVDPERIKAAVIEYLAQNPVKETDPTVPAWAKHSEKPTYTADEVGAVASNELSNAVNDALAKAKASGEFDGRDGDPGYTPVKGKDYFDGQPGYTPQKGVDYFDGDDYVLTDDDRTEIAELAAELVDVPGISVTGATVGQTVKIAAVDENGVPTAWESVDFPSGGVSGGGTDAREILCEGTLEFPTAYTTNEIPVSMEKLREYKIFGIAVNAPVSTNYKFRFGGTGAHSYGANGQKAVTLLIEWLDDAKTIMHITCSPFYQNSPFYFSAPFQLSRGCNNPMGFPVLGTDDTVLLEFSVAQTSAVPFCVWGVIK